MKNFITAAETNRRIAGQHSQLIDQAVEIINKMIRDAAGLPVKVPASLFGAIPAVKWELFRKLKEESGWEVTDLSPDRAGDIDPENVYLYYPPVRREELRKENK